MRTAQLAVWIAEAGRTEAIEALPGAKVVHLGGGQDAYPLWFAQMWERGESFISVEHDVAPTPAQIEAITVCESPWCAYEYQDAEIGVHPPLGCIKIGADLIEATPQMWVRYLGQLPAMIRNPDTHRVEYRDDDGLPQRQPDALWLHCDLWLDAYSRRHGFEPCRHLPHVMHLHG